MIQSNLDIYLRWGEFLSKKPVLPLSLMIYKEIYVASVFLVFVVCFFFKSKLTISSWERTDGTMLIKPQFSEVHYFSFYFFSREYKFT